MPPAPSIASRKPPVRTTASFTGTLVDPFINRVLVHDSTLEQGLALILCTTSRVKWIWDQPEPVYYRDDDGRTCRHTFDFLAFLHCGRKVAYAVKPAAKVESSGIVRTLELIRAQVGEDFADAYVLRTDRHITKARVSNARLILYSQADRDEEHVACIRDVTRSLPCSMRISDIAARSGLDGHALRAIACLIGDGVLRLTQPGLISHLAFVSPGPRAS